MHVYDKTVTGGGMLKCRFCVLFFCYVRVLRLLHASMVQSKCTHLVCHAFCDLRGLQLLLASLNSNMPHTPWVLCAAPNRWSAQQQSPL